MSTTDGVVILLQVTVEADVVQRLNQIHALNDRSRHRMSYSHTQAGGDRPPPKRARKIFFNTSENKSSDRKLSLIPSVPSAYYVE